MELVKQLEDMVVMLVADIHTQCESDGYKSGVEQYLSVLKPTLKRYQHHLGYDIEITNLQNRYEHETALVHILTTIFTQITQRYINFDLQWPIYERGSLYKWYKIPQEYFANLVQFTAEFLVVDSIEDLVSKVCVHVLKQSNRRFSGEYYTPLPIANHLIDLSGFEASELMSDKSFVDPACGSGIILALVVKRAISTILDSGTVPPQKILENLSKNIYGFDIQPFAVFITRTLLLYTCLPIIVQCDSVPIITLFPEVKLRDALLAQQYWVGDKKFDYIVGNPPFFPAKKNLLDYVEAYEEVLYGHPNLYQLFLWWAVRASRTKGIISFLVPQSMLSGYYYKKLREKLNDSTKILSVTRMIDRSIVDDADQQMMAVCLQVESQPTQRTIIKIRITRNGDDISTSKPYLARYDRVIQKTSKSQPPIWIVSSNVLDYTICEYLEAKCVTLAELDQVFKLGNGGYVWNQHRELIQTEYVDGCIPLVSAASIQPYKFTFPYTGSHPASKRPFSLINTAVAGFTHNERVILIQRITPRKTGRRLAVSASSDSFHNQYSEFFLENHVNYVKIAGEGGLDDLYGLMGWLNCDLVNFAFQLRNGTVQVSLSDLDMLPVSVEILRNLTDLTKSIVSSKPERRAALIQDLNSTVYDWVGLGATHRARIEAVLSRKEREE